MHHLQRPDIRMQPVSRHLAQDPSAQGLGPYTEIPVENAFFDSLLRGVGKRRGLETELERRVCKPSGARASLNRD